VYFVPLKEEIHSAMRLAILTVLLLAVFPSFANVRVYTGVYQGKDLYVKNPFSPDGVGFCVFEVRVNGEITTDEWNSSAFAIDFSVLGLNVGDPVEVVIRMKDSCEPRIINPEAIAPESTFEVMHFSSVAPASISFSTINETAALDYEVEQFKWNKWVKVATVEGRGLSNAANQYTVKVPLHSGENTFRIAQRNARGMRTSEKYTVAGAADEVKLVNDRIQAQLEFSSATDYEVFDAFGRVMARGYGRQVDTSAWPSGTYYVNFDRSFGKTVRKR
jgi:hypothetical protein